MARMSASILSLFRHDEAAAAGTNAGITATTIGADAARSAAAGRAIWRVSETSGARVGPGWFESSWDLQRGLEVREGLPADVRWHEWVEVYLRS